MTEEEEGNCRTFVILNVSAVRKGKKGGKGASLKKASPDSRRKLMVEKWCTKSVKKGGFFFLLDISLYKASVGATQKDGFLFTTPLIIPSPHI